jgi:anti-sigma factor RsiW
MEHPPEAIMDRYLHGLASNEEHEVVEEHLIDCSECCKQVAEFARSLVQSQQDIEAKT